MPVTDAHEVSIQMLRLLTMTLCGVLIGCASTPAFDYGETAYEQHIALVTQGMPPKMVTAMTAACGAVRKSAEPASVNAEVPAVPADPAASRVPPMRVFDNLYFVGDRDI